MDGNVSHIPTFVHSGIPNSSNSIFLSNSFHPTVHSSGINVATWNVEGISDDKIICLTRTMHQFRIHILCITKTHIEESFQFRTNDGYFVFYSGSNSESPHHSGVGFITAPSSIASVIGCSPISNRICSLKLRVTHGVIGIICAYAPHNGHALLLRQQFFQSLQDAYNSLSVNGPKMIFGDLNARLHHRLAGEHHILGPNCFGDIDTSFSTSNNRSLLMEACESLNLCLTNTLLDHEVESLVTYWGIGASPMAPISHHNFAQL